MKSIYYNGTTEKNEMYIIFYLFHTAKKEMKDLKQNTETNLSNVGIFIKNH